MTQTDRSESEDAAFTRRRLTATIAVAGSGLLAGCFHGGGGSDDGGDGAY